MQDLPPLTALRAFSSVGRRSSLTAAAQELGVSPSAVSQQVKHLEQWLGTSLFSRVNGSLKMNATGERYFDEIWQALSIIEEATQAARGKSDRGELILSVLPSFATLWLLPRLSKFHEVSPGINISLNSTTDLVDFKKDPIDIGVRFGPGQWPGLKAHHIALEHSSIVCTPETLRKFFPNCSDLDDVNFAALPFIDDRGAASSFKMSLSDWLQKEGRGRLLEHFEIRFSDSHLAVAHVLRHNVFLLSRRTLVDDYLTRGDLVAPFGSWIQEQSAYYAVHPERLEPRPITRRFLRWIQSAGRAYDEHVGIALANVVG